MGLVSGQIGLPAVKNRLVTKLANRFSTGRASMVADSPASHLETVVAPTNPSVGISCAKNRTGYEIPARSRIRPFEGFRVPRG